LLEYDAAIRLRPEGKELFGRKLLADDLELIWDCVALLAHAPTRSSALGDGAAVREWAARAASSVSPCHPYGTMHKMANDNCFLSAPSALDDLLRVLDANATAVYVAAKAQRVHLGYPELQVPVAARLARRGVWNACSRDRLRYLRYTGTEPPATLDFAPTGGGTRVALEEQTETASRLTGRAR